MNLEQERDMIEEQIENTDNVEQIKVLSKELDRIQQQIDAEKVDQHKAELQHRQQQFERSVL